MTETTNPKYLGAVFAIFLHSLTDFNLQIPSNAILFFTFVGLQFGILLVRRTPSTIGSQALPDLTMVAPRTTVKVSPTLQALRIGTAVDIPGTDTLHETAVSS